MTDRPVFLPVAAAFCRWAETYDGYDNPMVLAVSRARRLCDFGGAVPAQRA